VSRRYGRFVDAVWILQRMDARDARVAREQQRREARRALGLAPERVPYASVEIVRVDGTVETRWTDTPPAAPTPEGQS